MFGVNLRRTAINASSLLQFSSLVQLTRSMQDITFGRKDISL